MSSIGFHVFLLLILIAYVYAQTCQDLATDCNCKLGLCKNPLYLKLMTKMCGESCKLC